ncbi:MAG: hypothetical protein JW982_01540 [Spirochaetes bacterium]|nr:hypothetical protein [Spirochaetota bacterium]
MKALKTVLFVIAAIIITSQTFNHIFVKLIEPRFSFLDNYKDPFEKEIDRAANLKELEKMYKPVFESMNKIRESNPKYEKSAKYKQLETKLNELRNAITSTESILIEKKKLIFYWAFGLFSILAGILTYVKVNPWIGISAVITGFSEMITWTSPLYHSHIQGYYELITLKLIFSLITLVLLMAAWILNFKYIDKKK